jgi:uncharacterized protein YndB with AHSA1/START domain
MQRDIFHQFTFSQPPELVWEYLTDPQLLEQWLMKTDFQPVVGHRFRFFTQPKIKLGFDGTVYCEVLEVIPHQKLVYSWKGGMSQEKPLLDSIVVWTLTPAESGTVLTLEHKGFRGIRNFVPFLIMNKGWAKIGKRMMRRINETSHVRP